MNFLVTASPPKSFRPSLDSPIVMIHTSHGGVLRRLPLIAACVLAACSGGGTGTDAFRVRIAVPAQMTGSWEGPNILTCTPQVQTIATGAGRAVWTGGTSTLTAAYGKYELTYTASEAAQIVGGASVSAGEPLVHTFPKGGFASFEYVFTLTYAVEGTTQTGSASAKFRCDAP